MNPLAIFGIIYALGMVAAVCFDIWAIKKVWRTAPSPRMVVVSVLASLIWPVWFVIMAMGTPTKFQMKVYDKMM